MSTTNITVGPTNGLYPGNNTAFTASSTGWLREVWRTVEQLFGPFINWIVSWIPNIGKSFEKKKSEAPSLSGRATEMMVDRLSDDHRYNVVKLMEVVENESGVKNFIFSPAFNDIYSELPDEIKGAFMYYLSRSLFINASQTVTAGFFAAMAHQIAVREIVRQAQNKKFDEVDYERLPKETKDAYKLFLNKGSKEEKDLDNLRDFFQLLEIPVIESEKKMTSDEKNAKILKRIQKHYEGKLEYWEPNFEKPPEFSMLDGLESKLQRELLGELSEIHSNPRDPTEIPKDEYLADQKDKYLECIKKYI